MPVHYEQTVRPHWWRISYRYSMSKQSGCTGGVYRYTMCHELLHWGQRGLLTQVEDAAEDAASVCGYTGTL